VARIEDRQSFSRSIVPRNLRTRGPSSRRHEGFSRHVGGASRPALPEEDLPGDVHVMLTVLVEAERLRRARLYKYPATSLPGRTIGRTICRSRSSMKR